MRPLTSLSIALAMTWAGAGSDQLRPQQPVHEVQLVARKFAFEPSAIQVAAGEPVRLVVRSADGVHGFRIRELKVDLQVPRNGDAVVAEFTAPRPGRYEIACSEFCGSGRRHMKAAIVSVAPTDAMSR